MPEEKTITVKGYFMDKQVTKSQFTEIWVDHARELFKVSSDDDYVAATTEFIEKLKAACSVEFDRACEDQVASPE